MQENLDLYYIGGKRYEGDIQQLIKKLGGRGTYTHNPNLIPPFSSGIVEGIVLIGRQEHVFPSEEIYLKNLSCFHERGFRVAAVLRENETLPRGSEGVDKIITRSRSTTLDEVAEELSTFFRS